MQIMFSSKDFILVVDKPKGQSSFWVVNKVKKLSGIKKVGHTGTLDPLATGVLPICVGEATKISDLLMHGDKIYVAKIKMGVRTDTLDAEGVVTETGKRPYELVTEDEFLKVLNLFSGNIIQIPPMYSAIKKDGVPLYKLARLGQNIDREGRQVNVQKIELLEFAPPYAEIKVYCSKGTYIRTLVDDIGEKLSTLAHVTELKRVASGIFDITQAIKFDAATSVESLLNRALSIEEVVSKILPVLKVEPRLAIRIANGFQLSYTDLMSIERDVNKWGSASNVALFSDTVSGEQKILAILKIIPQDFEDLINMNSSSKIAKTLRIFHNEEWRAQS